MVKKSGKIVSDRYVTLTTLSGKIWDIFEAFLIKVNHEKNVYYK